MFRKLDQVFSLKTKNFSPCFLMHFFLPATDCSCHHFLYQLSV